MLRTRPAGEVERGALKRRRQRARAIIIKRIHRAPSRHSGQFKRFLVGDGGVGWGAYTPEFAFALLVFVRPLSFGVFVSIGAD